MVGLLIGLFMDFSPRFQHTGLHRHTRRIALAWRGAVKGITSETISISDPVYKAIGQGSVLTHRLGAGRDTVVFV